MNRPIGFNDRAFQNLVFEHLRHLLGFVDPPTHENTFLSSCNSRPIAKLEKKLSELDPPGPLLEQQDYRGQDFFMARPMPMDALQIWLRESPWGPAR